MKDPRYGKADTRLCSIPRVAKANDGSSICHSSRTSACCRIKCHSNYLHRHHLHRSQHMPGELHLPSLKWQQPLDSFEEPP